MSYKLAIASTLLLAVHFTMATEDKPQEFKFSLTCDRLSDDQWNARIKNDKGEVDPVCIKNTLLDITKGWQDQTIVVDDSTGEPAAYCREALEAMFNVPGLTDIVLWAYRKEVSARVKN